MIGRCLSSMATTTQQGDADRKHTVTDSTGVGSRAREEEEEELQVREQEDRRPHPDGKRQQVRPGDSRGRGRQADPASLHTLQTECVHLKDVVHRHDTEQKVERHAHPTHPLTEVHHPPYFLRAESFTF